jgi:hypothetical protein
MTALARTNSNCKWKTSPLIREGAQHKQSHNSLTVTNTLFWAPDGGLTSRQSGRLTVGRNAYNFGFDFYKTCNIFGRSRAGTLGSNLTRGMAGGLQSSEFVLLRASGGITAGQPPSKATPEVSDKLQHATGPNVQSWTLTPWDWILFK